MVWLFGGWLVAAGDSPGWTAGEGHQWRPLAPAGQGTAGFTELGPARTGILFTNWLATERSITNQILLNGSGVAAGDVDGDGLIDLHFCGLDRPNALYRGLGNWRFEDITERAGVGCADQASAGAALADADGDGDLDLLVTGLARGVRLFLNDGRGRFAERTEPAGLAGRSGGTTLALADVDGDGHLDLYLGNYRSTTLRDEPMARFSVATTNNQMRLLAVNGRPVTAPELLGRFSIDPQFGVLEHGEADVLYRNRGDGRFEAVDWTDGTFLDAEGRAIKVPYDWTLSAMFRDMNGDGAPDLYVCADFQSQDRIWINNGRGGFRALPHLGMRQSSLFTMGIDFADIDRDGRDDFFVADMLSRQHALRQVQLGYFSPFLLATGKVESRPQYSRNMLFWNRGEGEYAEIAQFSGLEASDWTWCPVFLDVDLDGYEDLLLVTGHERDAQNVDVARHIDGLKQTRRMPHREQLNLRQMFPRLDTPNFAFRNQGNLRFVEAGSSWGFESQRISQGIALADLDGDGDQDVVINCLNDAPLIYRNDAVQPRVAVRLAGLAPNTQGVGARIVVQQEGFPPQSQEIVAGGRYLSSDDPSRTFAVQPPPRTCTITVDWRSGRRSVIQSAAANRLYRIFEPSDPPALPAPVAGVQPLFSDVSERLGHRHHDEPFDDFQRQPLLPRRLGGLGPGVGWHDLDGDGREDLFVGGGRGGRLTAWRNAPEGGFVPFKGTAFDTRLERDQTTVLAWEPQPGKPVLTWGSATYEDPDASAAALQSIELDSSAIGSVLARHTASVGPLALGDLDGDGDLDLFVGGRVVAGRYPEPAASLLLRSEGGRLRPDSRAAATLQEIGLVSGAVWTDLTGDGRSELVLALEWGSLRVLRFEREQVVDLTESLGLHRWVGWWNSVTAGDFDGDGRMDLVGGNWGRNTRYEGYVEPGLHIYYGDLGGDSVLEVIDAYHAPELGKIVPWRDWMTLGQSLPWLRERYGSFTEFSTAGVEEMLGDRRDRMRRLTVNTLDSMVLLNRGDHFERRELPTVAQLSPVFGMAVADFNGDGHEDLVVTQNFFPVSADASRSDAGGTALLRGDGKGGFEAVAAAESGLRSYGEGRGIAVADFDQDGRPDLVLGQNNGVTRLFRNATGRPGLRVRLRGPAHNPQGIGAVLRPVYAGALERGAARELHAGGGYWSQDSSVVILGGPAPLESVEVRWPGGQQQNVPVPEDAREILIQHGAMRQGVRSLPGEPMAPRVTNKQTPGLEHMKQQAGVSIRTMFGQTRVSFDSKLIESHLQSDVLTPFRKDADEVLMEFVSDRLPVMEEHGGKAFQKQIEGHRHHTLPRAVPALVRLK